jgi:hypothetical protein
MSQFLVEHLALELVHKMVEGAEILVRERHDDEEDEDGEDDKGHDEDEDDDDSEEGEGYSE